MFITSFKGKETDEEVALVLPTPTDRHALARTLYSAEVALICLCTIATDCRRRCRLLGTCSLVILQKITHTYTQARARTHTNNNINRKYKANMPKYIPRTKQGMKKHDDNNVKTESAPFTEEMLYK